MARDGWTMKRKVTHLGPITGHPRYYKPGDDTAYAGLPAVARALHLEGNNRTLGRKIVGLALAETNHVALTARVSLPAQRARNLGLAGDETNQLARRVLDARSGHLQLAPELVRACLFASIAVSYHVPNAADNCLSRIREIYGLG